MLNKALYYSNNLSLILDTLWVLAGTGALDERWWQMSIVTIRFASGFTLRHTERWSMDYVCPASRRRWM